MSGAEQCGYCGAVLPAHAVECPLWRWPAWRGLLKALVAGAVLAMLFGCAAPTVSADPRGLSPEQLRALAADRNATVACTSVSSIVYADVTTVLVTLDRGAISGGQITVGAGCAVQVLAVPGK